MEEEQMETITENLLTSAESDKVSSSPHAAECQTRNLTLLLYDAYNGIPGTLLVNAIGLVVLFLLFNLLRKIAWDYGRLALVHRREENSPISSYNVWTSLFFGDRETSSTNEHQQSSLDVSIHTNDTGIFRWIFDFVKLSDQDILRKCGSDAVQYLSFQRYLLVYLIIITVLSIGVILPVNFEGNLLGNATEFGHTTIGNLDPSSPMLWLHAIFSVVYLFIMFFVLHHFNTNLDVDENEQVSRTLMISNIPTDKCNADNIRLHFQEAYPELTVTSIEFAYNINKLVKLDRKRKRALEAYLYSELDFAKHGERPTMRPYKCGQCCCSPCCKEVDAIKFYLAEEEELKLKCDKEKESAYKNPLGIAFVTLPSETQAQRVRADFSYNCKGTHNPQMSSVYAELRVQNWQVHFAPPPDSIFWENLSIPQWKWYLQTICMNSSLIILLFFLTTPIMFLHTLDLIGLFKNPGMTSHSPIIVQFLPTLLLWLFSATLPRLFYYSDQLIGHWTKSTHHHSIMRKSFIFLQLMTLILPSLGLTSARALFEWAILNQEKRLQWECIFLPSNGSFFVNYVITAGFIGVALELLRFSDLFFFCVRFSLARSSAEKAAVRKAILMDYQFGMQYAWMLCIFSIIISYSIACPLITPFGLTYMCLKHLVDRYNIFYAFKPSRIDKNIHNTAITFVLWSVIMLQMVITFFTGLRSEGWDSVFLFSCIALFVSLIVFVGRISFGWFKRLRRNIYYKQFDEEYVTVDQAEIQRPFIARVLTEAGGLTAKDINPAHSYGATDDATAVNNPDAD